MLRTTLAILAAAAALYFEPSLTRLAAIWDSQANPKAALVTFRSGEVVEGHLSFDWAGKEWLEAPSGRRQLDGHLLIRYQGEDRSILSAWRLWLPMGAALGIVVAALATLRSGKTGAKRSKPAH